MSRCLKALSDFCFSDLLRKFQNWEALMLLKKSGKKQLLTAICLLVYAFSGTLSVSAATDTSHGNSHKLLSSLSDAKANPVATFTDGHGFVQHMMNAADSLDSYSFNYKMSALKGDKTLVEQGDFYFKKPKLMRLEVTEGKRKGSIAVLQSDGRVHGKAPGLGFLASMMTLAPDSRFLKSVNGYPMVDSDFCSLARALKKFLDDGATAKITTHTVSERIAHQPAHLIEVYTDKTQTQLFKRVFVDANSYLPVEWYDYEDGKLSSESSWQNFKNDPGMPATLFSL
jgi:outer membrane lipoprotein-sorting protein